MKIFWPQHCRIQIDGAWIPTQPGRELEAFLGIPIDFSDYQILATRCISAYTRQAILEDVWCAEHWPQISPGRDVGNDFRDEGIGPDGTPVTSFAKMAAIIVHMTETTPIPERPESNYPKRPLDAEEQAFHDFATAYLDGPGVPDAESFFRRT